MMAHARRREYGSLSSRLEAPDVGRTMGLPYGTLLAQTIGDLLVPAPRSAVGISSLSTRR
jgi:hypothetical protein